ncbi:hypothetical protein C8Q75DRAFT_805814 [Abortiporus biennis]|nr:hypothetical protein C8Q75DRAFT_805814 [Abortiporus biennis]
MTVGRVYQQGIGQDPLELSTPSNSPPGYEAIAESLNFERITLSIKDPLPQLCHSAAIDTDEKEVFEEMLQHAMYIVFNFVVATYLSAMPTKSYPKIQHGGVEVWLKSSQHLFEFEGPGELKKRDPNTVCVNISNTPKTKSEYIPKFSIIPEEFPAVPAFHVKLYNQPGSTQRREIGQNLIIRGYTVPAEGWDCVPDPVVAPASKSLKDGDVRAKFGGIRIEIQPLRRVTDEMRSIQNTADLVRVANTIEAYYIHPQTPICFEFGFMLIKKLPSSYISSTPLTPPASCSRGPSNKPLITLLTDASGRIEPAPGLQRNLPKSSSAMTRKRNPGISRGESAENRATMSSTAALIGSKRQRPAVSESDSDCIQEIDPKTARLTFKDQTARRTNKGKAREVSTQVLDDIAPEHLDRILSRRSPSVNPRTTQVEPNLEEPQPMNEDVKSLDLKPVSMQGMTLEQLTEMSNRIQQEAEMVKKALMSEVALKRTALMEAMSALQRLQQ